MVRSEIWQGLEGVVHFVVVVDPLEVVDVEEQVPYEEESELVIGCDAVQKSLHERRNSMRVRSVYAVSDKQVKNVVAPNNARDGKLIRKYFRDAYIQGRRVRGLRGLGCYETRGRKS